MSNASRGSVQVEVRHDWGTDRVYPDCATARQFLLLTGKRTFSAGDLQVIRGLGYTITMAAQVPVLPAGFGEAEVAA